RNSGRSALSAAMPDAGDTSNREQADRGHDAAVRALLLPPLAGEGWDGGSRYVAVQRPLGEPPPNPSHKWGKACSGRHGLFRAGLSPEPAVAPCAAPVARPMPAPCILASASSSLPAALRHG